MDIVHSDCTRIEKKSVGLITLGVEQFFIEETKFCIHLSHCRTVLVFVIGSMTSGGITLLKFIEIFR